MITRLQMVSLALMLALGAHLGHGKPHRFVLSERKAVLPGSSMGLKSVALGSGYKTAPHALRYPLYMMQLYRSFTKASNASVPKMDNPALQEADTVLSLVAKTCLQQNKRWSLFFDMTSISSSNEVRLAQLRIRVPSFTHSKDVTVEIYHSHDHKCKETQTCQDQLFLGTFIAQPSITSSSSWQVFNITNMLKYWLNQGTAFNNGEHARAMDVQGEDLEERPEATSIPEPEPQDNQEPDHPNPTTPVMHATADRVMLVVFSKDRPTAAPSGSPTLIKTVESSKYVMSGNDGEESGGRRHRRTKKDRQRIQMAHVPATPVEGGKLLCRKVDMFVDFEQIGWGSWIVYPKRYNAYRCEGQCPTPVDETFSPTNHAYMQSLLKLYHPSKVDCPYCVPVKTSPLSMLYYENSEVVLRHHEDMVVEECGCN